MPVSKARPGETRERVAQLISQGLSQSEIATKLGITSGSVAYHIETLAKLKKSKYNRNSYARSKKKHEPILLGNEPLDRKLVERIVDEAWNNLTLVDKMEALGKLL